MGAYLYLLLLSKVIISLTNVNNNLKLRDTEVMVVRVYFSITQKYSRTCYAAYFIAFL